MLDNQAQPVDTKEFIRWLLFYTVLCRARLSIMMENFPSFLGTTFNVRAQMTNTPQRAQWWIEFICTKCQFPAPEKLRAQFQAAELSEFCDCGCNSFKVQLRPGSNVLPIATPGGYGEVFEADFRFAEEDKTLEVILLADENGNLAYVEIDCCANSYPIPEAVVVIEPPFHVHASEKILAL